MANSRQSKKRARQTEKRRLHHAQLRSMLRTYIKHFRAAVASDNTEQAQTAFERVVKYLDSFSQKKIIHRNKASRLKHRFAQHLKDLVVSAD